tara:strand:+ start:151 stop:450 length:300 start_codon:yes stop_codon:yes gene_type:complete
LTDQDYLNEIIEIFNNTMPSHITLEALETGTMDLTDELDSFDYQVREILELDEGDETSIENTKSNILAMIEALKSDSQIQRSDLLIYQLELLCESLDDL